MLETVIEARFIDPAPRGCWCESVDARGVSCGEPLSMATLATLVNYAVDAESAHAAGAEPELAMHAA